MSVKRGDTVLYMESRRDGLAMASVTSKKDIVLKAYQSLIIRGKLFIVKLSFYYRKRIIGVYDTIIIVRVNGRNKRGE